MFIALCYKLVVIGLAPDGPFCSLLQAIYNQTCVVPSLPIPGWALIRVNFDTIQEIVGGGRSFVSGPVSRNYAKYLSSMSLFVIFGGLAGISPRLATILNSTFQS